MAQNILNKLDFSKDDLLTSIHWTEDSLAKLGVRVTPELVAEALGGFWQLYSEGRTGHAKKYVPFDKGEPKWTEGALVGFVNETSGVKNIHFGRDNRSLGLPVSHADMILRNKETGVRLITLECITISDLRTGWFALTWADLVLQGKKDIEVFMLGAGPVAKACIRLLNAGAADKIKSIAVYSLGGETNHALVKELQSDVKITLTATNDRTLLPKAGYIITATNAGEPVLKAHEIGKNAKVLSQGIDDLPAEYIKRLIDEGGLLVGDDLEAMEARNVDPLALFYSRGGKKLTVEGKQEGAMHYSEVLNDQRLMRILRAWDGPAAFFPVGLAGYDIAVGTKVLEGLKAALDTTV